MPRSWALDPLSVVPELAFSCRQPAGRRLGLPGDCVGPRRQGEAHRSEHATAERFRNALHDLCGTGTGESGYDRVGKVSKHGPQPCYRSRPGCGGLPGASFAGWNRADVLERHAPVRASSSGIPWSPCENRRSGPPRCRSHPSLQDAT